MRGIENHSSPNFGPRRGVAAPDMVVLHYTGMDTAEAAIARLTDPASEVSAHYLVDLGGLVVRMVGEDMRAWHAGSASWGGVADVNSRSIGIEIVNPGRELGYPPFPEPQVAALEALLVDILARHAIAPERVVGHACVAPGRKGDPGEKFDWRRLARRGLSVWLDPEPVALGVADSAGAESGMAQAARFQSAAAGFGYGVPGSGEWCEPTCAVWRAFVMRFLPFEADAPPHRAGIAHLERLAARWPCAAGGAAGT
ncbi:MAG: N-acetylmuramoyl-L-alanine amidase [Alphaproteobacteria bacterium]